MTGKVVNLPGIVSQRAELEPQQDVIEFLQALLLLAESGELVGIGCFIVGPGEGIGTDWKGSMTVNASLSGALQLQYDLLKNEE